MGFWKYYALILPKYKEIRDNHRAIFYDIPSIKADFACELEPLYINKLSSILDDVCNKAIMQRFDIYSDWAYNIEIVVI